MFTPKGPPSDKIKHVVVLMMENRAFDHLLGWLKEDFNQEIDGLKERDTCVRDPNDLSKGEINLNRRGYDVSPDDPLHDFDNTKDQINNNNMNGFISNAVLNNHSELNPVSAFDASASSAPVINTLAKEFAIFDSWFSSLPGPTDPNRAFAMSGTSEGMLTNFNGTLYTQQSYFDYLVQRNKTFTGYFQRDLWALGYFKDVVRTKNIQRIFDLDEHFYEDVSSGAMTDFTWLQPSLTTPITGPLPSWQHPDASVQEGERLIKKVYEVLRSGPRWNSTLFIITYDEHGGFFDHVSPPSSGVVSCDDVSFKYYIYYIKTSSYLSSLSFFLFPAEP